MSVARKLIPITVTVSGRSRNFDGGTEKSSLQLGLRVGGHLALTDFGPKEPQ